MPTFNYFIGTSNACPMVAGIIALVEQYQKTYKGNTNLNVTIIQKLFRKTGDALEFPPSHWGDEMGGTMEWYKDIHPQFPYATLADYEEYNFGWGIIDGYEMYKYFRENY